VQPDQIPSITQVAYLIIALTMIGTGATLVWSWVYKVYRSGREIIPFEPRNDVPWQPIHLVFYATITVLLLFGYVRWRGPEQPALQLSEMALLSGLQIVGLILGFFFLLRVANPNRHDFGLPNSLVEAKRDFRTGALASVALVIPILTTQALLAILDEEWTGEVHQHPIFESITKRGSILDFLQLVWIAILVAPLVEEFFFRILLQGWLEKLAFANAESPEASRPLWPILISSLLFAAMHASGGPDPIPIFLLALALGYLYRQTHRLLPSLALHMCFNAYSVGIVLLEFLN
jgi:membrane protease YdiL (CAAX protease family)